MAKKSSYTLEQTIEDYLVDRAVAVGGQALKLRPPVGRGFPDRTLVLPHAFTAFVEVKRPVGGKFAAQQQKICDQLAATGHAVYLVSNKGEIDRVFEDYEFFIQEKEI